MSKIQTFKVQLGKHINMLCVLFVFSAFVLPWASNAQVGTGQYARIAVLRPFDGETVDFEAGYIRHLEWHKKVGDPWVWYGWSVWAGERQRWFIYATFGHTAMSLDSSVMPAEDERDNVINVVPHCEFKENGLYQFLAAMSFGSGVPRPAARVLLVTIDVHPGREEAFEAALKRHKSSLRSETLWYRMIAGGTVPRYLCIQTNATLSGILLNQNEAVLPDGTEEFIKSQKVEILNLRPTMSYGLPLPKL